jgi:hypothetical protein
MNVPPPAIFSHPLFLEELKALHTIRKPQHVSHLNTHIHITDITGA